MKQAYVAINTRGPAYDVSRRMEDQALWREHAEFMDAVTDDGLIALAGPLEGTREVLLVFTVEADQVEAVRARMATDPWVRSGHLVPGGWRPWTIRIGRLG